MAMKKDLVNVRHRLYRLKSGTMSRLRKAHEFVRQGAYISADNESLVAEEMMGLMRSWRIRHCDGFRTRKWPVMPYEGW